MTGPGQPEPSLNSRSIAFSRVIDLSHELHPAIPRWPEDPTVSFETVARLDREGYFLRRFSLGEHTGTHLNAPASFHPDSPGLEAYPPESLIVAATVLDLRDSATADPDYTLDLADVRRWEAQHGPVRGSSVALLLTGWAEKWPRPAEYLGGEHPGGLRFPGFGLEAARFLLEERNAAGLGIDTPGVDPGRDDHFAINRLALERPRIVLENLTNLDRLPPTGATLVIGILRLRGGSGSPASVLALVP